MRKLHTIVCIGFACLFLAFGSVTAQAREGQFVVKDMRGASEADVIIMATKGVDNLPVIVLFGANREVLAKVRNAALESERAGYGVKAILVGPTTLKPSLEIYATTRSMGPPDPELGALSNAWGVTEPINPYTIKQAVLVRLIRLVHEEYYEVQ